MQVDTVTAPYGRPGKYELGLYKTFGWNSVLVDVMHFEVKTGTAPGGIQLFRKEFKPGDPIDLRVTLPPNRYYYGHWSGPTIMLFPLVIDGRRIPAADAAKASYGLWLNSLVHDPTREDGVSSASRGTRAGTYLITKDTAAKYRLNGAPLVAPAQPGQWEIRLYDRGYPDEDYLDLALFTDTLVVEPAGFSPLTLRFVRNCGTGSVEIRQLLHQEPFQVEARFEPVSGGADPAEKPGSFAFIDALGQARTRQFTLRHISGNLYCSPVMTVAEPPLAGDRTAKP